MKINNKEFEQFHASVVSFSPATLNINNNIIISESDYMPINGVRKLEASRRDLVIDFINDNDISDFTAEIMEESILNIDDGFLYRIWLIEQPSITQEGVDAFTVTFGLYTIKQKTSITLIDSKEVVFEGNVASGMRLELTAAQNVENVTINDILVKELKGEDTFVIDGIDKLVYYASAPEESAFDNVVMTSFPKAVPGSQSITLNRDDVSFKITYAPTYL